MNGSSRVLQQLMKHREQARSNRDNDDQRPLSAMSLYDIGLPVRLSEPLPGMMLDGVVRRGHSTQKPTQKRPSSDKTVHSLEALRATPSLPVVQSNTTATKLFGDLSQQSDAPTVPSNDRPSSSGKRPPSPPCRKTSPRTTDLPELQRVVGQLQSRVVGLEVQLQQANAQRRILAIQVRKYKAKVPAEGDSTASTPRVSNSRPPSGFSTENALMGTLINHESASNGEGFVSSAKVVDSPYDEGNMSEGSEAEGNRKRGTPIARGDSPVDGISENALLELSAQHSTAEYHDNVAKTIDREKKIIAKALGAKAAEKFAFAVDVRNEEDLKELLLSACNRLNHTSRLNQGVTSGEDDDDAALADETSSGKLSIEAARSRQRALVLLTREGKTSSKALKGLVDAMKQESIALLEANELRLKAATQLNMTLMQQLQLTVRQLTVTLHNVTTIKSMILGEPLKGPQLVLQTPSEMSTEESDDAANGAPVSLSRLNAMLNTVLSGIQATTRHCVVTSDVILKNNEELVKSSQLLENVKIARAAFHRGGGQETLSTLDNHPSSQQLVRPDSASSKYFAPITVAADLPLGVSQLRREFETIVKHCTAERGRVLRDHATEEDLLMVYQKELAEVRRRLVPAKVSVETQTVAVDVDDASRVPSSQPPTVPVPSPVMTIPVESQSSRPASGMKKATRRPSSSGGHSDRATPVPPALPPVIKHLIVCVNALHVAFTEATFGAVRSNSQYASIAAQLEREEEALAVQRSADQSSAEPEGIVLVDRSGKGTKSSGSATIALERSTEFLRQRIERNANVLPTTYGSLLRRDVGSLAVFPSKLSPQDEADLAANIDSAQRLVEIGMIWHQALGTLRVHHCSSFLFLVRHSKSMQAAYFFHDANLAMNAVQDLENNAPSFAEALRTVIWQELSPAQASHPLTKQQKKSAIQILYHVKLLSESMNARAKLNWRGLLLLHKHMRTKQIILQAVKYQRANGTPQTEALREETADALRRIVTAFYADWTVKLETEQRLLKSSLKLTVDAVWTELIALLRESATLCLNNGINVDLLDALGPTYSSVLLAATKELSSLAELQNAKKYKSSSDGRWKQVITPARSAVAAAVAASHQSEQQENNKAGESSAHERQLSDNAEFAIGQRISQTTPAGGNSSDMSDIQHDAAAAVKDGNRAAMSSTLMPLRTTTASHNRSVPPPSFMLTSTHHGKGGGKVFTLDAVMNQGNPWISKR